MNCIVCGEELNGPIAADDPLGQWTVCDNPKCEVFGFRQATDTREYEGEE